MIFRLDWRSTLRDPRTLILSAAFAATLIALALPPLRIEREGVDVVAVVDITGSMNTRDYLVAGQPASRLDMAKAALKSLAADLPCSSRLGLALFAERVPFLLFDPIDVCRDFSPLAGAIDSIDWREAWQGDSHIAAGLFRAIDMAKSLDANLVFITDGQEAPPLPTVGGPTFEGRKGEVRGLLVGAGGAVLSPIPKFDDRGNQIGFWSVDEVPHENRFGPPPPDAESRPGYEARNAPFGAEAPKGSEHLSSMREAYLKSRAAETGLAFTAMTGPDGLAAALLPVAAKRRSPGDIDLRPVPGALALLGLVVVYGMSAPQRTFRLRNLIGKRLT